MGGFDPARRGSQVQIARLGARAGRGVGRAGVDENDLEILSRITKSYVESVIDTSLRRLRMERLDLVQFHWWNYEVPAPLEARPTTLVRNLTRQQEEVDYQTKASLQMTPSGADERRAVRHR